MDGGGPDAVHLGQGALSFSLDIRKFVDKTHDRMDLTVRYVSLELFRRVVLRSPVDTGRFRANWQVEIGGLPQGTLELDDRTGAATVSRADAELAGVRAGDTIYLVNNLPYGPALERGSSKQAPAGMVGISVEEFDRALNGATAKAKRERP